MNASIVRADRIEFDTFARVCDLHPELLDRLVALGLLETLTGADGRRWFERSQITAVGRIRRLRSGLRLSYSAIAVVAPLIDRIDELEDELRRAQAHGQIPRRRSRSTTNEERRHAE